MNGGESGDGSAKCVDEWQAAFFLNYFRVPGFAVAFFAIPIFPGRIERP